MPYFSWMLSDFEKDLISYQKLQERLIAIAQGLHTVKPRLINNPSQAHHYIPRHFIDGFLNEKKMLWRYDKVKDKIVKNQQGPKGVFFEFNRNSVQIDDKFYPIFEHYHSIVDSITPFALKLLRCDGQLLTDSLISDLYEYLALLIVDLYWRNPNTDALFDRMYNSQSIYVKDSEQSLTPEEIAHVRTFPETKQQVRINLALESIRKTQEYLLNNVVKHGMVRFSSAQLCLGDVPYIMRKTPNEHIDLIRMPMFLPISSNKLYVRNLKPDFAWDLVDRAMLNALVIEQSSSMVVCAEKPVLELAIKTHKIAKSQSLFIPFKAKLFGLA